MSDGTNDLLISGRAIVSLLELSQEDKSRMRVIVDCLLLVKGLVVYRASPSEKAELVKLVRAYRPDITTLAIGDGANDVNMIQ